ncbi:MAG: PQQ-binding-like beta-propeller repeat protein [Verrucomicrobiales bacterium]|nr:PQQ-binding-like beta-propeller repeat protein [Verrucomicrobiales bacterium]
MMKFPAVCALLLFSASFLIAAADEEARKILRESGIQGGLIVHIGVADGELAAALHKSGPFVVHGLATSAEKVKQTRDDLMKAGVYGPVSIELLEDSHLPLNDNLVNLIIADDLHGISMDEVNRVLCPNGVALISGKKTVKPRPEDIDDWTHYFHGADGNAVAQDEKVGPPTRLQWLGNPRWSRHHDRMASMSALVSGGGRLFYIMDEGSRISIQLPSKWMLVARDAFNSTILWKQPIKNWHDQLWPLKSGPTQLAKRLVTDGERVFAPLALGAPVSCLDAATGKILATCDETTNAEEMVLSNGILYVLSNPADWALKDFTVKLNTGDQGRVSKEFGWNGKERQLSAINVATGETLWAKETKVSPLSLVADETRVIFHDGEAVVNVDAQTGEQNWRNTEASRRSLFEFNFGPRIVLHDNVVLYAGGDGKKMGLNPDTGETMWKAGDPKSGYKSPQDLLVASGLVWTAPLTSGKDSGVFTGLDPVSGEVKKEFPPNVETYWFHHRCYISKATEKYIMPSRTGIEFIDHEKEHWDINHWVRGGCLYGVMPANGFTYAPPHNCACYPEAKLFGFNALSATGSEPPPIAADQRLLKGSAYDKKWDQSPEDPDDWPTYRHDKERSGFTEQDFGGELSKSWKIDIGGKLSAPTIAGGKVYISAIDSHTVYALDEKSGEQVWNLTVGGRVDSPPTIHHNRAVFGCSDGNVYCVTADTGELFWKFRAAPSNRKTMVFDQLESLWPVPGSVLVEDEKVSFVAGRSAFLDGGMKFYRLNEITGEVLVEKIINDRDPETGGDLQDRVQTLQMPVGLNDILSSNGIHTYLRSQKITEDGTRIDIGPVSGNAALHGGTQAGEGAHVFAPMGFLDDTWFHRSYWVYGKNFAGGHNGYYQAGKYAPSGRILVFDKENVYGYGREPQYLKWTTTLEHQLFSASRQIEDHTKAAAASGRKNTKPKSSMPVVFRGTDRINPAKSAFTVEAWVMADAKSGVVVSHGGNLNGYALTLKDGVPQFQVRANAKLSVAEGRKKLSGGWHHLAGVLNENSAMKLYVDGKEAAAAKSAGGLISKKPVQPLEFGGDSNLSVGNYPANQRTAGLIDEVAVYLRALSSEEIEGRVKTPGSKPQEAVIFCSFDAGNANDESGGGNHGVMSGADSGKGIAGSALWIQRGKAGKGKAKGKGSKPKTNLPKNNTYVDHQWTQRVPIYTRAMALANDTLVIAGPPDIIDEEYTFERLAEKDTSVHEQLAAQDKALNGEDGAIMQLVSKRDGGVNQRLDLESLPVWDGMAVAQGKLFVCGEDGSVRCFAAK